MDIKITISRDKVYESVAKETVYVGGRSIAADEATYDKVFVTDDDRQMLDNMYRDICQSLNAMFAEFLTATTETSANPSVRDKDYSITLTLPDNSNGTVLTTIDSDIYSFVTNALLAGWLSKIGIESAALYQEEAKSMSDTILHKIYARRRTRYKEVVSDKTNNHE